MGKPRLAPRGWWIVFFLLGTCSAATAAPITFYFEGTVDILQGPKLDELLGPGVTAADLLGTSFHGSYTFDPAATDSNASPQIGSYSHLGAPFGMTFHFAHRSFSFESITMLVVNDADVLGTPPDPLDDTYAVQSLPRPHPTDPLLSTRGRLDMSSIGTELVGPITALVDDSIPLVPPDPTTFDQTRVFVNVLSLEEVDGELRSLVRAGLGGAVSVLRLPEPSAAALLVGGWVALMACRRRGRRSHSPMR